MTDQKIQDRRDQVEEERAARSFLGPKAPLTVATPRYYLAQSLNPNRGNLCSEGHAVVQLHLGVGKYLVERCGWCPDLEIALQKLVEAKDAALRALDLELQKRRLEAEQKIYD